MHSDPSSLRQHITKMPGSYIKIDTIPRWAKVFYENKFTSIDDILKQPISHSPPKRHFIPNWNRLPRGYLSKTFDSPNFCTSLEKKNLSYLYKYKRKTVHQHIAMWTETNISGGKRKKINKVFILFRLPTSLLSYIDRDFIFRFSAKKVR